MKSRHAFTLIELLVVIAVIALLIGILLPALGKARNTGRMAVSMSNCRQIMIAAAQYRTESKDQMPMRGALYTNGLMSAWNTWSYGGKAPRTNNPGNWGNHDEPAYGRPLNPFMYPEIVLEKPQDYYNVGTPANWTFVHGTPTTNERETLQMPAYRSPGDKISRQGRGAYAYGLPDVTGLSSYDDVGTSYHSNMKWFYQADIAAVGPWRQRFDEGVRRCRLASEYDPTGKFVWMHDQTADLVAHFGDSMGEFGNLNKSVMTFLDGRAEYLKLQTRAYYDGTQLPDGRWVIGKYTFIFPMPGRPLPPP